MKSMANASFCMINRYWRRKDILASERALETGWIGCSKRITQPIFNVIHCIWGLVVEDYTPSMFIQGDFNTFWLWQSFKGVSWSRCLPNNVSSWPWSWERPDAFGLREIGNMASYLQVARALCQRWWQKPTFTSWGRVSQGHRLVVKHIPAWNPFLIKNNGSSCGYRAWTTSVFVCLSFPSSSIFNPRSWMFFYCTNQTAYTSLFAWKTKKTF